jgi:tetratricopeptide (TPR) repeat protein
MQLKNHMGVPLSLADSQIAMKDLPLPGMAQTFPRPEYPYYDRRRGVSHYLMPVQMENQLLRVQDFMVEDIAISNNFKFPLFFSRTVPASARVGLDANLETEAMVLRLLPERKEERFDVAQTEHLLWKRFRFRNFNNPDVTLDDNEAGMMIVYPEIALELHEWYLKKNDTAKALAHLERAVLEFPFYPRTVALLHDYYKSKGEADKAKEVVERSRRHLEKTVRRSAENPVWWMFLSNLYHLEGNKEQAYRAIQTAWEIHRAEDFVFRTYVQYCLADGRTDLLLKVAREWLENHPDDSFARQILSQFGTTPQLPQGLPSR